MTEKELEFAIEATTAGYEVLKDGWPDFLLVKNDELLVVEIKNDRPYPYRVSNHSKLLHINQVRLLLLLEKAGLKVRVSYGSLKELHTVHEFLARSEYRVMIGEAGNKSIKQLEVIKKSA